MIIINKISALTFFKSTEVHQGYDELYLLLPPIFQPLMDYFEDIYVGRRRPNGRATPKCLVELWNIYQGTLDDSMRTNNLAESWHRRFSSVVQFQHPSLWIFIQSLKKGEENYIHCQMVKANAGNTTLQKKKYLDYSKRLKNLLLSPQTTLLIDKLKELRSVCNCIAFLFLTMSDIEQRMIFEFLPNEILIECFTYLNAFNLFYSFDELNSRLNNLIRNVRLCINFEYVNKTLFDKFCAKMLIDTNIQNQIHSIEILNDDQCFQCNLFLSSFPPNKFPNLQRFIWTPPLLSHDEYSIEYQNSYLNQSEENIHLIIKQSDLPLSQLRALATSNIAPFISNIHQNSIIKNLKISTFHLKDSECLCNNVPMLKYLHIKFMNRVYVQIPNIFSNHQHRFHLKQLIIDQFTDTFANFEMFVKQTPNLKSLTFISHNNDDINIIDANRWEYLIVSSIPKLDTFNLKCSYYESAPDFWKEQHHWCFEYIEEDHLISFYTIPYICDTYQIEFNFTNSSSNLVNTFANVKKLTLKYERLVENSKYYFTNVTSLTLSRVHFDTLLTTERVQYLKMMINLFNLKHLDMPDNKKADASCLLEIFKQTPQLSSISIDPDWLQEILNNKGIFEYLTKMIKNFNFIEYKARIDSSFQIKNFCKIFPNIEHLQCRIHDTENVFVIIDNLPKLSTLKIKHESKFEPEETFLEFKNEASKRDIPYYISFYNLTETHFWYGSRLGHDWFVTQLFIWIGNKRTLD
ncbi:unnamed protein product [Rotaria socialis]|uniref:F-box domain-containing protein n=1 Tax=Rotaria socialis TaxID=392032 RepID=A0A817RAP3_9BILA|nr:unnamed protein product [Rotaria socialis]